ncbi:dihydrofolate reductase [bacterium]|nr:dihydrofolate reductase [bacterium]
MSKTQFYGAASLDGFLATENHSLDWLMQFGEMENETYSAFIEQVGALAMGSSTYEWLLRELKAGNEQLGGAWPYKQPTWVFSSRQLPEVAGADLHFVQGDVRPVHQQMQAAAAGKNIWIIGGGDLVGQFYDAGLLNELIVQVTAVTLGSGQPLLPRQIITPPLQLTSATMHGSAFAELRYDVQYAE